MDLDCVGDTGLEILLRLYEVLFGREMLNATVTKTLGESPLVVRTRFSSAIKRTVDVESFDAFIRTHLEAILPNDIDGEFKHLIRCYVDVFGGDLLLQHLQATGDPKVLQIDLAENIALRSDLTSTTFQMTEALYARFELLKHKKRVDGTMEASEDDYLKAGEFLKAAQSKHHEKARRLYQQRSVDLMTCQWCLTFGRRTASAVGFFCSPECWNMQQFAESRKTVPVCLRCGQWVSNERWRVCSADCWALRRKNREQLKKARC